MIIYGTSLSFFVRKVLAYAAERGIEVETRIVNPRVPDPEFAEASPLRKIPAMRDGNYCLSDSSAIIHYLEAKYPEGALIPAEPAWHNSSAISANFCRKVCGGSFIA